MGSSTINFSSSSFICLYLYTIFGADHKTNKFSFTYTETKLECSRCQVTKCLMNITQFQLKYEVYEALMAHYTEHPLISVS